LVSDLLADYGAPDHCLAQLVSTQLDAAEVICSTANEFGLEVGDLDTVALQQKLRQYFAQSHHKCSQPLLVADEAQIFHLMRFRN